MLKHNAASGFTLVEILIVVIILGILAAIVIPQFTQASQDARNSAVTSDLQTFRSQLELYKVQHQDRYPTDFTGKATDTAWFITQLTTKTDKDGVAGGTLGPYLQKIPNNPFAQAGQGQTLAIAAAPGAADGSTGWAFNTANSKLSPNDANNAGD